MKPKLPERCNVYLIRRLTFHLPVIKHKFTNQLIEYNLLELLNTESNALLISSKVHTHSFVGFKIYIKNKEIDCYRGYWGPMSIFFFILGNIPVTLAAKLPILVMLLEIL